jgi:hypothetical protein
MTEGVEVIVELRGDEVVLRRLPPPARTYVDYYVETPGEAANAGRHREGPG